jgi:hypothetical protein
MLSWQLELANPPAAEYELHESPPEKPVGAMVEFCEASDPAGVGGADAPTLADQLLLSGADAELFCGGHPPQPALAVTVRLCAVMV